MLLISAHRLVMLNICAKFHEIIWNGIKVIEQTRFLYWKLPCAGPGKRIGQTYPSEWRKSLSKRGDQASPAQFGKTARLKGSL